MLAFLGAKKKKKPKPSSLVTFPFFSPAALKCSKHGRPQWNLLTPTLYPETAWRPAAVMRSWGLHSLHGSQNKRLTPSRWEGTSAAPSTKGRKLPCPTPSAMRPDCVKNGGSYLAKMRSNMMNRQSRHQLYRTKCYTLSDRHWQVLHLLPAKRTSALLSQTLFQFYSHLYFAWWAVPMKTSSSGVLH